jgi:hypothetical protein
MVALRGETPRTIWALKDSGSTHTIASNELIGKLPGHSKKGRVQKLDTPFKSSLAVDDGKKQDGMTITKAAWISITFKSPTNGTEVTYEVYAYIVPNLVVPFIIGADVLHSKIVIAETPEELHLSQQPMKAETKEQLRRIIMENTDVTIPYKNLDYLPTIRATCIIHPVIPPTKRKQRKRKEEQQTPNNKEQSLRQYTKPEKPKDSEDETSDEEANTTEDSEEDQNSQSDSDTDDPSQTPSNNKNPTKQQENLCQPNPKEKEEPPQTNNNNKGQTKHPEHFMMAMLRTHADRVIRQDETDPEGRNKAYERRRKVITQLEEEESDDEEQTTTTAGEIDSNKLLATCICNPTGRQKKKTPKTAKKRGRQRQLEILKEDIQKKLLCPMEIEPEDTEELPDDEPILSYHIKKDRFKNKEEKEADRKSFKERGYFQKSASSVIEEGRTIQQLETSEEPPLTDEDIMRKLKTAHLSYHQASMLKALVKDNLDCFARHPLDVSFTDIIKGEVDVKDKMPVFSMKYQSLPLGTKDEVQEILAAFQKAGVIEPFYGDAPYVQNIMTTKKKSGKLRLLLDSRLCNLVTTKRVCTVTSQEDLISTLAVKGLATIWDIVNAYYNIRLTDEAKKYFVFYGPGGRLYNFAVCPQGFCNSSFFLTMMMIRLFSEIPGCLTYIDDILLKKEICFEQHLMLVNKVFAGLRKGNLKVSIAKFHCATPVFEFLGFVIDHKRLTVPELKMQGLEAFKRPLTKKQVRSFAGALNHYRTSVRHFAEILIPITDQLRAKENKFTWTKLHECAFIAILRALKESCSRYIPDPKKPYVCFSDASDRSIGFTVNQELEDKTLQLVVAKSRTLNKSEQNYSTYKKEAIAISYGLTACAFYLRFAPEFLVLTDAKGLIFVKLAGASSPILARTAIIISQFNMRIQHVEGKLNTTADLLSRSQHENETNTDGERLEHINEKEAIKILDKTRLKHDLIMTAEQVKELVTSPPPLSNRIKKRVNTSRAKLEPSQNIGQKKMFKKSPVPKNARFRGYHHKKHEAMAAMWISINPHTEVMPYMEEEEEEEEESKEREEIDTNEEEHENGTVTLGKQTIEDKTEQNPEERTHYSIWNEEGHLQGDTMHFNFKSGRLLTTISLTSKDKNSNNTTNTEAKHREKETINPRTPTKTHPSTICPIRIQEPTPRDLRAARRRQESAFKEEPMLFPEGDAIERLQITRETLDETVKEGKRNGEDTTMSEQTIMTKILSSGRITLKQLEKAQALDHQLNSILEDTERRDIIEQRNHGDAKITFHGDTRRATLKIYLPHMLLKYLFYMHHYTNYGIHRSAQQIYASVSQYFSRPNLRKEIKELQEQCFFCITQIADRSKKPKHFGTRMPDKPRTAWGIDYLWGLPKCENTDNTGILIFVDLFSLYIILIPVSGKGSEELTIAFTDLIKTFIPPQYIRSDRETSMKSGQFQALLNAYRIEHIMTPRYWANSNGTMERHVAMVKEQLRLNCMQTGNDNWDTNIHNYMIAHNTCPLSMRLKARNCITPEEIMFGTTIKLPYELLQYEERTPKTEEEYTEAMSQKLEILHKEVAEKKHRTQFQKLQSINNKRKDTKYDINQLVYARDKPFTKHSTMKAKYDGPYIVRAHENATALLENIHDGKIIKSSYAHMIPAPAMPDPITHQTNFAEDLHYLI